MLFNAAYFTTQCRDMREVKRAHGETRCEVRFGCVIDWTVYVKLNHEFNSFLVDSVPQGVGSTAGAFSLWGSSIRVK